MDITTYGPGGHDPAKPNSNVVGTQTLPDDPALANRRDYEASAGQAIDTLESGWDNWASLSAAQKDAVLKLTVRVVTRLARLVLGRLT